MKQIMIVDDSPTMLMSMEGILKRGGYGVTRASSGEEAIAQLRSGVRPNLIITDLNMGGINGVELIRQARQMPASRFTPMLMLTTESAQNRREEAKAAGATGWLVKPVQADALLAVVKQVVPGA